MTHVLPKALLIVQAAKEASHPDIGQVERRVFAALLTLPRVNRHF